MKWYEMEPEIQWEFCRADLNPENEISNKTYKSKSAAIADADRYMGDKYGAGAEYIVFSFYICPKYEDVIIVERELRLVPEDEEGYEYDRHCQDELARIRKV